MAKGFCTIVEESVLDETKAGPDYRRLATQCRAEGHPRKFCARIRHIARDEDRHRGILRVILATQCRR